MLLQKARNIHLTLMKSRNIKVSSVKPNRQELYKYISGIIENKKCHLYRINGVENHIHILTHLHPTVSLSSFTKDIKMGSTDYIKKERIFRNFRGWQEGYGAFTYSLKEKNRLIEYIKNQEEHHRIKTFKEEYVEFLKEHGIEYNEKYIL